jgi:hypothetical protein
MALDPDGGMPAGSPTGSPTGSPDLVVDPAAVLELAQRTRTIAGDVVGDRTFAQLDLDGSMLGGFPGGHAVARAHRSAHAVVAETMAGVSADLEDFSGYLEAAVAGLEDADTLSQEALDRLAAIQVGHRAEQANLDARTRHVPAQPDGPAEGGGSPGADAPVAAPTG